MPLDTHHLPIANAPPVSDAPGAPGNAPTWTSSAKDVVGGSLGPARLWFTLGFGIVTEVYYPRVDLPQIRDLGFIVGDDAGFWVEVKRLGTYDVRLLAPGVPAVEILHRHPRFRLRLRITPDPLRDVLLIEATLTGDPALRLYVLLAPRLGATGEGNVAAVARYRGRRVLWAEQGPYGLALVAADAAQRDVMGAASAGYVGVSDGWQDFAVHGALTWEYDRAGPGNVALVAALPAHAVLALGFAATKQAAATLAVSSLLEPFAAVLLRQVADWQDWYAGANRRNPVRWEAPDALGEQFMVSAMVLRSHLDKTYPGAMVASLSIPWGDRGTERGGYHLVWPRDLVQCATALLALGAEEEARNALRYLIATQREDGHWEQNQWLGGRPYWQGKQLDQTACPVVLAALLGERDALGGTEVADMIAAALGYLLRNGPVSEQDRWEESAGITPYTLACVIAALVAGAAFLPLRLRWLSLVVADFWNAEIERWLVARGGPLAAEAGIAAHYVHLAPAAILTDPAALATPIPLHNQPTPRAIPANALVSLDFLALVRFGLRRADDALMVDSLKLADALLKTDTPSGPVWHRYVGDGYGETEDGAPYVGAGRGRGWPLLAGERGQYELAAGRDPLPLLQAMAKMAGKGGMIPEQVWDAEAIPRRFLYPGRPTGSATPLAWAHAEFVKLVISRQAGRAVDAPAAVGRRYRARRRAAVRSVWMPWAPVARMTAGTRLVVVLTRPAALRWEAAGTQGGERHTLAVGFGLHAATLRTEAVAAGNTIMVSWRWRDGSDGAGPDGGEARVVAAQ
ncbi:MAG: glycoside hydrolase family 15 protein [Acidibrevibacterium sp.]|uniref:glycoside hydrolase family 15 protein n=1 Tax=Acidibrevibacterium sp. TaxID=2606776 RepID=UPI003CFE55EB